MIKKKVIVGCKIYKFDPNYKKSQPNSNNGGNLGEQDSESLYRDIDINRESKKIKGKYKKIIFYIVLILVLGAIYMVVCLLLVSCIRTWWKESNNTYHEKIEYISSVTKNDVTCAGLPLNMDNELTEFISGFSSINSMRQMNGGIAFEKFTNGGIKDLYIYNDGTYEIVMPAE